MAVNTLSGAKISIGPVAAATVDSLSEFEALSPYVLIGEVEDMGEIGDEAAQVKFANVGARRVRTLKGAFDAGVMQLICGHDPLDTGQIALKAALATKFAYAFKVELADAPSSGHTNTFLYWSGQVFSNRFRLGQNDNVVRSVFGIGVNSDVFEDPAAPV